MASTESCGDTGLDRLALVGDTGTGVTQAGGELLGHQRNEFEPMRILDHILDRAELTHLGSQGDYVGDQPADQVVLDQCIAVPGNIFQPDERHGAEQILRDPRKGTGQQV
ncbi:hypothetical protein OK351_12685 [Glutamicibacter sp. MNS18]|uniref:hypothetical protein n=1 Tax=Glutamicibacter sp. MNS18 TaxID=2989817 RepID=UPI002235E2D6|nr:hypothetical protein [Glutamicibacter sp. MNS18]MCW4466354.1 hypothetical protein [Glutamicibacter sp. MNS18]